MYFWGDTDKTVLFRDLPDQILAESLELIGTTRIISFSPISDPPKLGVKEIKWTDERNSSKYDKNIIRTFQMSST